MSREWSDSELVDAVRAGRAGAAEELEARYRRPLERFAYGYLGKREAVEDAVQDVLCKVLATETPPHSLRPWLYRVTRNFCLNQLDSSEFRASRESAEFDDEYVISQTGHLTKLVREEQRLALARLVQDLSADQREVLRLRYAEDLTREEIATVLDVSISVVKSRLYEGLKRLRALAAALET